MTWNNRIMRHFAELNGGELTPFYQIHEVYYDEKGKVDGWTDEAIAPRGDTVEELIEYIEQMLGDAKKSKDDVLDYEKEGGKMTDKELDYIAIEMSQQDHGSYLWHLGVLWTKADSGNRADLRLALLAAIEKYDLAKLLNYSYGRDTGRRMVEEGA